MKAKTAPSNMLILGDLLALAIVVAIGMQMHQQESLARLPFTWLPYALAWCLTAWALGLFVVGAWRGWRLLGRVVLAMLLASPLAAVLRGAWLGTAVQPLFVLIMGLSAGAGVLLWRWLFSLFPANRNG